MRILFFILISICFVNCERKSSDNDPQKSYFDKQNLSKLSLENIDNFWENDSLVSFSNYFDFCSGYFDGIGFENKKQGISIAVFESKEKALECMEGRIKTVSCVIERGSTVNSSEIWWYSDCIPKMVFRSQYNTIIEVYYNHSNYNEIEPILLSVSNDLANIIDSLSE